jgi:hypothetical protein
MKKLITILLLAPILAFGQEKNKEKFLELNVGLATIGSYNPNDISPGTSFLYGQTIEFAEKGIFEYQLGIAAPSIVTGKLALGLGNIKKYIGIAVRPWPLTVGPQAKVGKLSLSFEVGTAEEISFEAGFISTIAYRWTIGGKKKNETED